MLRLRSYKSPFEWSVYTKKKNENKIIETHISWFQLCHNTDNIKRSIISNNPSLNDNVAQAKELATSLETSTSISIDTIRLWWIPFICKETEKEEETWAVQRDLMSIRWRWCGKREIELSLQNDYISFRILWVLECLTFLIVVIFVRSFAWCIISTAAYMCITMTQYNKNWRPMLNGSVTVYDLVGFTPKK